jgi:hypothetical protein
VSFDCRRDRRRAVLVNCRGMLFDRAGEPADGDGVGLDRRRMRAGGDRGAVGEGSALDGLDARLEGVNRSHERAGELATEERTEDQAAGGDHQISSQIRVNHRLILRWADRPAAGARLNSRIVYLLFRKKVHRTAKD